MELEETTPPNELESVFTEIQSIMSKENQLRLRLEELLAKRRRQAEAKLEEAKCHLKKVEEDENMRRVKLIQPFNIHPLGNVSQGTSGLDPVTGPPGERGRKMSIDPTSDTHTLPSPNAQRQPCSSCQQVKDVARKGATPAKDIALIESFLPDLANNVTWKRRDRMKLQEALSRTIDLARVPLD
ncbi:hypothetical protein CPB86DRAFT_790224 [Serendipita vermifera]|nr:hypothetical protein CPB86DRAFT_790224 [Serendipita vermifera]